MHDLLHKYTKDKHLLTKTILNPRDRQHFTSVLKMCDAKVIDELLKTVCGSNATRLYLQMIKDIITAFMDPDLMHAQRIRCIWYPLFIIRIWRKYIETDKTCTLKDNFLSAYSYTCLELNAHGLILLMIHLKETDRPELFMPFLFDSQACESLFRQLRSFTSTYPTVANCTAKEAILRISKIQLQNEIMHSTSTEFIYPRLKKKQNFVDNISFQLPEKKEIIKIIEKCKRDAIITAKEFGLIHKQAKSVYACKLEAYTTKNDSIKVHHNKLFNIVQRTQPLLKLDNIQLKDFAEKLKKTDVDSTSPYVQITKRNGMQILVKKNITVLGFAIRLSKTKF